MSVQISDQKPVKKAGACDAITLEVVAGALRSTVREMESVIERTAMSPFIREKKDFNAGIFSGDAQLVGTSGIQASLNTVEAIFQDFPRETIRPGDIYWYNDCYASNGAVSHTPDQVLLRPVFADGEIVAFTQSWAHFNDIGGLHPGTLSPEAKELFHEGIIVPPVRLARNDEINEDLVRMFARNSRYPDMVRGDIRALLAAVKLGERRMTDIVARFGADVVADAFAQLIARTAAEVLARARKRIPVGEYEFTEILDSDGQGNGPFNISYRLSVGHNRISFDASESSDQTPGPFNFLMSPESPATTLAGFLLQGDPRYPSNAGTARVLDEIVLREGSLLKPRYPAALGMRGVTAMRCQAAWMGLLAKATNGDINGSNSSYVVCYVRGRDADGKPFLITDPIGVGYGARPFADGNNGIYLSANENYPAEFVESAYPLRIRRYAIAPDSGGAGRWRGGCGIIRDIELLATEGSMAIRLDSVKFPPWGVSGGKSGARGYCIINPGRPDEREIDPISEGIVVKRGDIIRVITGGGGGWGHPYDREPERVLDDVLGGFVSREKAASEYGVVITAENGIDIEGTEKLRLDRPEAKLFHRNEYLEQL